MESWWWAEVLEDGSRRVVRDSKEESESEESDCEIMDMLYDLFSTKSEH